MNCKSFFLLFLFCTYFGQTILGTTQFSNPKIQKNEVSISGKIKNLEFSDDKKFFIEIRFTNPISGPAVFSTQVDSDGNFSINFPIELSPTIVGMNVLSETLNGTCLLIVDGSEEMKVNAVFDEKQKMSFDIEKGSHLFVQDSRNIIEAMGRFEGMYTRSMIPQYYKMTPLEIAVLEFDTALSERTRFAIDTLLLSEEAKKYLTQSFALKYCNGMIFKFKENVKNSLKSDGLDPADYSISEPGKSYYSFLRQMNLNDPQYMLSYSYEGFIKSFLNIKDFNIQPIGETPIDHWIEAVSREVSEIIGINSGLFYDMLVANAYDLQLSYQLVPLTDKQIGHIKHYFTDDKQSVADLLLKESEEISQTLAESNDLNVNHVVVDNKEKLIDNILQKYQGKVVMMDFWATWCGPCKEAFAEMRPLKNTLKNKDVVFVYITNESSPKDLWNAQIKAIGGEHYYLTDDEFNLFWSQYKMRGVPTYLIFDKDGMLKHSFTGFPGIEMIEEKILELLL